MDAWAPPVVSQQLFGADILKPDLIWLEDESTFMPDLAESDRAANADPSRLVYKAPSDLDKARQSFATESGNSAERRAKERSIAFDLVLYVYLPSCRNPWHCEYSCIFEPQIDYGNSAGNPAVEGDRHTIACGQTGTVARCDAYRIEQQQRCSRGASDAIQEVYRVGRDFTLAVTITFP